MSEQKKPGPCGSDLSAEVGLDTKRAGLRTNANVAAWGCTTCATVWSASDHRLSVWFAAGWLIFAAIIIWIGRSGSKEA
jgi:hypothetical protein